MDRTIENLQSVLQIEDKYLTEKLRITQKKLKEMKSKGLKEDYRRVKSILIHERVQLMGRIKSSSFCLAWNSRRRGWRS